MQCRVHPSDSWDTFQACARFLIASLRRDVPTRSRHLDVATLDLDGSTADPSRLAIKECCRAPPKPDWHVTRREREENRGSSSPQTQLHRPVRPSLEHDLRRSGDYLGDWCATGTTNNRGTEWDWLRFLWDLDTGGGVSTTTIFQIYNVSNPGSWNATGDGTGGSYPAERLRDAADDESVLSEWDYWDDYNGVHR